MELLTRYAYSAELPGAVVGALLQLATSEGLTSGGVKGVLKRVLTASVLGLPLVGLMAQDFVPDVMRNYGMASVALIMYGAYSLPFTAGIAKQIEDNVFGAILDKFMS